MGRDPVTGRFKKGLVYGIGVDDDPDKKDFRNYVGGSVSSFHVVKSYSVWKNMLRRCYHKSGCYFGKVEVDSRWHTYSNFKAWFDQNYKEGYELDKDILGGGLYSPEQCLMIPRDLNRFLLGINDENSGVWWDEGRQKYQAYTKGFRSTRRHLGRYQTYKEAKLAWVEEKELELKVLFRSVEVPKKVEILVFGIMGRWRAYLCD